MRVGRKKEALSIPARTAQWPSISSSVCVLCGLLLSGKGGSIKMTCQHPIKKKGFIMASVKSAAWWLPELTCPIRVVELHAAGGVELESHHKRSFLCIFCTNRSRQPTSSSLSDQLLANIQTHFANHISETSRPYGYRDLQTSSLGGRPLACLQAPGSKKKGKEEKKGSVVWTVLRKKQRNKA